MDVKKYFLYDKGNSNFLPVEYNPLEQLIYSACIWIIGGVVLGGLGIAIFSSVVGTPAEIALRGENKKLLKQLNQTRETIKGYKKDLNQLAQNDNELYRSMLGMEPIPEGERKAGAGGADIYSEFDAYTEEASEALKWTAENLEKMEYSIDIQKSSFNQIKEKYNSKRKKFARVPAIKPVDGPLVSGYGLRYHPILKYRRMHEGIDFDVNIGDKVYATGDGVVKRARRTGTFGNLVIIDHGYGYETYYSHLSAYAEGIKLGTKVKRGEKIGLAGESGLATGPNLHYEVQKNGDPVNPINYLFTDTPPAEYLKLKRTADSSNNSMD